MPLKVVHDTVEEIPEAHRELYSEQNGKWVLTGITGVYTQTNLDRLQASLEKERNDHKETRDKLTVWGDLDHTETMAKLDRIPELEAAAKDKLDEAKIDEIVARRVEGTIQSRTAPLERENKTLKEKLETVTTERDGLIDEKQQRRVQDTVRAALIEADVRPEAYEDALLLAERHFEIRADDDKIVTRDQVGVTPGVEASVWLTEMLDKRPHWPKPSRGGGAPGSRSGEKTITNPWDSKTRNLTEQARILKENPDRARQLAKLAGVELTSEETG